MKLYRTICADPPWPYRSSGTFLRATREHRPNSFRSPLNCVGAATRYGTMSIENIRSLAPPAEDNAHLYLWTTNAFMCEAHEVARAWGFAPKTILTWVKIKPDGTPSAACGYYFRGATEHIVFAVRGSQALLVDQVVPTAFLWPRLKDHSAKPDAFYDLVEQVSPGPYLELFARRNRLGWDTWGLECLEHVAVES